MKKEWSLSNDKAIINFSVKYCSTSEQILNSEGFRSVLFHFLAKNSEEHNRINVLLETVFGTDDLYERSDAIKRLTKLLTVMTSKEISEAFPEYAFLYDQRLQFRHLVEEVYNYWRKLERYAIIDKGYDEEGFAHTNFIQLKMQFDDKVLDTYRKITNNLSMTIPNIYRQVPAGTNVGLIVSEMVWPIPTVYNNLKYIPFIKNIVLETPYITYPKRNKRDGVFQEVTENPISRASMNVDHFFCYPAKIGDLIAFIFIHRDFLTQGVSLSNLFEMAKESEIAGKKPDLIYVYGAADSEGRSMTVFYDDEVNDIMVGYVTHDENYDYFGYLKKMSLTLHNLVQIKRGFLPVHGAMVNIVLKNGKRANVVIVGDSGAGKSESIEAFRSLAEEHISDMTIIFDDMGTLKIDADTGEVMGYGTETGAFVRLDDLDAGYAFKELDRSIFMNPDKINARLISPVATYEEIMQGLPVDFVLYANNYTAVKGDDSALTYFDDATNAIDAFRSGKRMAKGTTTEEGLTTSYFANPFGPLQKSEACDVLLDKYFAQLFAQGVKVGELKTQLGIPGNEKKGPEEAAIDLFEAIKKQ